MQPDAKILASDGLLGASMFLFMFAAVFLAPGNTVESHIIGLVLAVLGLGSIMYRSYLKHVEKEQRQKK